MNINSILDKNIEILESDFKDCSDYIKRKFPVGDDKLQVYIAYIEQMADNKVIDRFVVENLMEELKWETTQDENQTSFEKIKNRCVARVDTKEISTIKDAETAILSANAILLIDGWDKGLVVSATGFPNRGIQASETEVVIQGAKEAFTEPMRLNTALIRRRIRDTRLKMKQSVVGKISGTNITLVYMEGLVREKVLFEVEKQLKEIQIDGVLDSMYVQQFLENNWKSVFPQMEVTERPDTAVGSLLEGRVVIIVDNTPFVIILPATLATFFQSPEDYCRRWQIVSFLRCIRYIAGILATTLPALYLAITLYHPSMLPTTLLLKMAGSRQNVPFPGVLEVFFMELAFEILREAGARMPAPIGGTIGIVGGIVIGQSAVEAGIVSPVVVIIVALTAICSFAIPHVSFVASIRLSKFFILFFSAVLGLYGFWLGILIVLTHLVTLKTYNIPYMFPFVSSDLNNYEDLKDSIIRLPLFMLRKRPLFANPKETDRMKK